jgi:murein DD-endopeptidase MepM/ murein hydrolase activator NlpD
MQILLIPENTGKCQKTCLRHCYVITLAVLLFLVVPLCVGAAAYRLTAVVDGPTNPEHLAQLSAELEIQRREIDEARERAEDHMNALALKLGKLQAQIMRVNALGQRLTSVAGLDQGEFDFSEEPALGGPEHGEAFAGAIAGDITAQLDLLALQVDERFEELALLQSLLVDRQLQSALTPEGWPVVGGYVSSRFGFRQDPFTGRRAFHSGVDIANRSGAPVNAMASGVVTYSGEMAGYGLMVEISHGNGYTTRYAHTLATTVKVGEKVEKGQKIAVVGSTGRSTGPHLHFELLRDGKAVNPRRYLHASR